MPVIALVACLTVVLSAAPKGSGAPLPLARLRLYETGVGYFERQGTLGAGTQLPVPAGHLDDALATLVVLSGEAHVSGVAFGSSVPRGMARSLAGLPPQADAPIRYADLLGSLKGAAVRVLTGKESFGGRLVDVVEEEVMVAEPKRASEKADVHEPPALRAVKDLVLVVVGTHGEVRRFRAAQVIAVQPLDPAFSARFDSALDALATRGAAERKQLAIAGTGAVRIGYVAETPVWRTSWRLVLDSKGAATLQGWALLHNDTDEDWQHVAVELVNGRPDSFLFPLAAPRYARRELAAPENPLSTVPQLADSTVDEIWGEHLDASGGEAIGYGGLGVSGTGSGAGGTSTSVGLGSVGTVGHGRGTADGDSGLLEVGDLAQVAKAEGVEGGALFTYKLRNALDLRAHGSALVPFVQTAVAAEPVTWLADPSASPRFAVRFENSTQQTLPDGPVAFFSGGGFAGEAELARLKPGERRFIPFGQDLDVQFAVEEEGRTETPKRLVFASDSLEEHFLRRRTLAVTLENRSGQPRTVCVGLDVRTNASVEGADRLDYDLTGGGPVAVFKAAARQKLERRLVAVEGLERRTDLAKVPAARLWELAAATTLSAPERSAARLAASKRAELDTDELAIAKAKEELASAQGDVNRAREDLRALGGEKGEGSAAEKNPFVRRVIDAEDRVGVQKQRIAALESQRSVRLNAVRAALASLASRSVAQR